MHYANTVFETNPAATYLLKVSNGNTRSMYKICSKLIVKKPQRHRWRHSGVFMVSFEHISHVLPVSLLLTKR